MRIHITILIAFVIAVSGCLTDVSKPSLRYEITPCSTEAVRGDAETGADAFMVSRTTDGSVRIQQNQSYVCCANITIRMEDEGRAVRIYEDNIGEMCRCICPFSADMTVSGASGLERIEVYGIRYRDVQGYALLFNTTLESGAK
jgi:hypothetical protein